MTSFPFCWAESEFLIELLRFVVYGVDTETLMQSTGTCLCIIYLQQRVSLDWFMCVVLQVLLGLDNAHHDDGESNHHSCGNNLLLRPEHHHLAGLQRGLGHHLPGGPGHELQDGDRQRGELRDHPRPQSHQDELPEELVCCGLPLLHSSGLYLFNSGERLWLRGI